MTWVPRKHQEGATSQGQVRLLDREAFELSVEGRIDVSPSQKGKWAFQTEEPAEAVLQSCGTVLLITGALGDYELFFLKQ